MKKYLLFLLSVVCLQINGQIKCDVEYKYPFYAGDEKWQLFNSTEERVAALQIPDSLLYKMSTPQLLESCLNYPYLKDVLFADDIEIGIAFVSSSFNGLCELLKRQDLMTVLISKEQLFPIELEQILQKDNVKKGDFSFKAFFIDFLILQYLSDDSINQDDQTKAINLITHNNDIKKRYQNIFGAYILSLNQKILDKENNLNRVSEEYGIYLPCTIYTPKGSLVPDTYRFEGDDISYTSAELENLSDYLYNTFNGATLIAPPSYKYNCHGYAWHVSEGGNEVWIGYNYETAEDIYWTDGSYVQTTESDATKVSYTYGNHSAIRINSTWYQSKWGSSALVRHHPNDVPSIYNASQGLSFYKRPPTISGPTVPCGISTYNVENIANGYIVQWSLQNHGTPSYLIQDSPSTNMCQIVNTTGMTLYDQLIANVYLDTTLIATVTKTIDTSDGFTATYSQPSYTLLGHTYPAIDNQVIHNGGRVVVGVGGPFTVTSSDFVGATITQTDGAGISWSQSGSTLTMQAAVSLNGQTTARATFTGEKGCQQFTFRVLPYIASQFATLSLSVVSDNNGFTVSLISEKKSANDEDNINIEQEWTLQINNAVTGKSVVDKIVKGNSVSVDCNKWEKGIYIVKGKIGDLELTKKIKL